MRACFFFLGETPVQECREESFDLEDGEIARVRTSLLSHEPGAAERLASLLAQPAGVRRLCSPASVRLARSLSYSAPVDRNSFPPTITKKIIMIKCARQ